MKRILNILIMILIFATSVHAEKAEEESIAIVKKMLNEKVVWAVSDVYPPYTFHSKEENKGFVVDVLKEIFEPLGYIVNYQTISWEKSLKMIDKGHADCLLGGYAKHAVNMGIPVPKYPIGVMRMHFFGKKGSYADTEWEYDGTEESLMKVKIGVQAGAVYGDEFDTYFKKAPRFSVQPNFGNQATRNNILKVLAGRIDVIIEDHNVLSFLVHQMDLKNKLISVGHEQNMGTPYYIFFSRKSPYYAQYTEILEKGLKQMIQSGQIDKIKTRYF